MDKLDHVVVAAPDLDRAREEVTTRTGVRAVDGGPHLGQGTRNALIAFDDDTYLEIIAPDPGQPPAANFGARLATLDAPTLLHWAIRTDDLERVAARVRRAGLAPTPVFEMSRRRTDGEVLTWRLLGIGGHSAGGVVPFYIDWGRTPHPALTAPRVGAATFEVRLPVGHPAAELLTPAPAGVTITEGPIRLSFAVAGLRLASDRPQGFAFAM